MLSSFDIPNLDGAICRTARKPTTIRGESNLSNSLLMAFANKFWLVIELYRLVGGRRQRSER
jgi:hypothetical protein